MRKDAGGLKLTGFIAALAEQGVSAKVTHLAVREMPRSGKPDELLHAFGIDADAIVEAARK